MTPLLFKATTLGEDLKTSCERSSLQGPKNLDSSYGQVKQVQTTLSQGEEISQCHGG